MSKAAAQAAEISPELRKRLKAITDLDNEVTSIDLRHNQLGDAGAQAIAEALKDTNCKVTEINLSSNQIGYAGAHAIAKALKDTNCEAVAILNS